jgi:hypothetical protein
MSGTLQDLEAYGTQDNDLYQNKRTGKPDITFFGTNNQHKTHSKFAIETIENIISGYGDFGKKISCCISRNGDLFKSINVHVTLPLLPKDQVYVNYLGYKLIENIAIEIGGQRMNRITGSFIMKYNIMRKTLPKESKSLFISQDQETLKKWSHEGNSYDKYGSRCIHLIIPIPMFLEHIPIPLVALIYHEVKLVAEITDVVNVVRLIMLDNESPQTPSWMKVIQVPRNEKEEEIVKDMRDINIIDDEDAQFVRLETERKELDIGRSFVDNKETLKKQFLDSIDELSIKKISFLLDYIFLDSEEKRLVIHDNHEFLYSQIQDFDIVKEVGVQSLNIRLHYNHPIKYILVTFSELSEDYDDHINKNRDGTPKKTRGVPIENSNFSEEFGLADMDECFSSMILMLNGQERCSITDPLYYREYQPMKYLGLHDGLPKGMYLFSFALNPMKYQPSGSLNASRIDNMQLRFEFPKHKPNGDLYPRMSINVESQSINVLRVQSGMAGLKYSK